MSTWPWPKPTQPTLWPHSFGQIYIKDDPLTIGLELSSELVSYAQGITTSAFVEELILFEPFTFVFTNKAYNGSTLVVLASNPTLHKYRELLIVDGTRVFHLAHELVSYLTYAYNSISGDYTIGVDMVVLHYYL
ncbi:UNVERIFIED_CONTAM: hypothetical protein Scaly_0833200 [Sesamum calycinum]|uniref:Dirigent protein n=1 Tax=Sesamum calycinum TaxID=2727403 RepID=A0AAW2RBY8_9LAMI